MTTGLRKVKAVKDDSGHWYILPLALYNDFFRDGEDENFVDSGAFENKYGMYKTGGDLNNTQLWAELEINDRGDIILE